MLLTTTKKFLLTKGETMSDEKRDYPEHKHPHGVENKQDNPYRIWVCEECNCVFADETLRRDLCEGKWGHACKARKYNASDRCEAHLEPYMPDENKP